MIYMFKFSISWCFWICHSRSKDWQGRFPDAPVGLVIDYMNSLGHGDFQGAAEGKEQACQWADGNSRQIDMDTMSLLSLIAIMVIYLLHCANAHSSGRYHVLSWFFAFLTLVSGIFDSIAQVSMSPVTVEQLWPRFRIPCSNHTHATNRTRYRVVIF